MRLLGWGVGGAGPLPCYVLHASIHTLTTYTTHSGHISTHSPPTLHTVVTYPHTHLHYTQWSYIHTLTYTTHSGHISTHSPTLTHSGHISTHSPTLHSGHISTPHLHYTQWSHINPHTHLHYTQWSHIHTLTYTQWSHIHTLTYTTQWSHIHTLTYTTHSGHVSTHSPTLHTVVTYPHTHQHYTQWSHIHTLTYTTQVHNTHPTMCSLMSTYSGHTHLHKAKGKELAGFLVR